MAQSAVGAMESRPKFRFMDLEIWHDAIEIGTVLFKLADDLESKRLYKFAEELRAAGLSMSNNIAEGSGSNSKKEFLSFLNISRRSTFENANILIVMEQLNLVDKIEVTLLLQKLDHLCRRITNFQRTLRN